MPPLLVGLPQYLIKRLQGVQNAAARSILRTPISEHISPLLQNLHWLPVNRRTIHKVAAHVILHFLALALNTCLTLLMFTPLLDPCTLPQILYLEHTSCQTKVMWSAYFCLPWSLYIEFLATRTQISTGI